MKFPSTAPPDHSLLRSPVFRRCPISRTIVQNPEGPLVPMADGPHVPPYYRDQMLLLMEVLDLDQAYYMEASLVTRTTTGGTAGPSCA